MIKHKKKSIKIKGTTCLINRKNEIAHSKNSNEKISDLTLKYQLKETIWTIWLDKIMIQEKLGE